MMRRILAVLLVFYLLFICSCAKDTYRNLISTPAFNYQEEVTNFIKKNKLFEETINQKTNNLDINWDDRYYYNSTNGKRVFHVSFHNPLSVRDRYSLSFNVDSITGKIEEGALLKYEPGESYFTENKNSKVYYNFTGRIFYLMSNHNEFFNSDSIYNGFVVKTDKKLKKKADGNAWSGEAIESDWYIKMTNGQVVVVCPLCSYHHANDDDLRFLDGHNYCFQCGYCLRYCGSGGGPDTGSGGSDGGGTTPPIDTGFGGGGNKTPEEKEKQNKKRDCDHIKKMKQDQALKNGLKNLKQHALDKNARTEKGMLYNTSDGALTGTPLMIEGDANEPAINIQYAPTTKLNGISHTHYQGLNPIFSASDIASIGILGKDGVIADKSSFCSTLITNDGNVYMLKIHDIAMFDKWASTFASDPLQVDNLINLVSFTFPMGPNQTISKNEQNLIAMMDALGTGLKLFRGNLDFSDWVGLKKNKNNNTIETDPCD